MSVKKMYADLKPVEKVFLIGSVVTFVLFYFSMSYGDVFITANHGIRFWDALFQGDILQFYSYNLNAPLQCGAYVGPYSAYYDFFIYVIFAVWNFPLWLIGKLSGIVVLDTVLGALWAKAISLPFLFLVGYLMAKISALRSNFDAKRTAQNLFLFVTSIFTVAYVVVIGQYDVIPLAFILAGIYAYLQGNDRLFLILFAIAIPIKAFSILIFVPLLLYRQKNLLKILLNLAISVAPMLLFRILIPFAGDSNVDILFPILFTGQISIGYGTVLYFALFAAFCIVCYLIPQSEQQDDRIRHAIYLSFVSFALFLFLCSPFPYWYMYLTPFVFLVMLDRAKLTTVNVLLETVFSFGIVLTQILAIPHCYSAPLVYNTAFSSVFPRPLKGTNMVDVAVKLLGEETVNENLRYVTLASMSIALGAVLVFAVLNCPWKKEKECCTLDRASTDMIYGLRYALAVLVCFVPLVCYFV